MQDETFRFSYAKWDFLSEALKKKKKKKTHFAKTASLRTRGQKTPKSILSCVFEIYREIQWDSNESS